MAEKSIIIIGAGISGLSAGCYVTQIICDKDKKPFVTTVP